REISLLNGLSHRNICKVIGVDSQTFPGTICLVTPWMQYGNLLHYINTNNFVETEIHRFLTEIATGLAYLHGQNVVHGDLHPNNILIDDKRHIQLTDFGLSNFADTSSASASSATTGAARYMAPEILDPPSSRHSHIRHTPSSDVYSFAMCCWTIYDLQPPFPESTTVQATIAILQDRRPSSHNVTHEVPHSTWEMMEQTWVRNPDARPTAAE
ncbi:hypothetical protein PHLGIDRAFT_40751, partial [Phlebiopsis gigantea 11061_1 CR5-6]